ncbi:TFIIIC transcription initiation factor complex subunits Tfc3 [Cordyceps fumosorosea ARSEF 2679]|uniref:TFIIIC transcription initiation factor complex subunits Tfc3 n=1 Tax=Cordyceps fumosorosea (strain ARSEF 2679) TaxID=1081104 RepID=A0A167YE58_CORFA|nr:TFIIIC transcription initiation factor complex subunits Tfc3 [Cordyceps fumosorosea ARSEF 2679]OAA66229.1 TFIIIC transcription initiation factor complex subunits Tfc3 [Cordyceps fumosorosea ARSEF 2679]
MGANPLTGATVWEVLASILVLLSIRECEPSQDEVVQILKDPQSDAHRMIAIIWKWLVERKDISVGHERKYNDLSLSAIISLIQTQTTGKHSANEPALETRSKKEDWLRLYVLEETMWELLAGHGVDYKRLPRSEWILLQGIASTTGNGILQGDLGRLVGQDKRSVPKRTNCLVEKGYITKRTILVRGTKTSKLWLRFLAPSTPDESNERGEAETDIKLSRKFLVESLEPVPWHTRWTGDSIDYKVLATTIMAICKEWNVMRLQDLKLKLGVLGMIWQMKVVSKTCRFLNARGNIQYVAAKLDNRIFKDCIRFSRDMNARDWSIFLATGKRTAKSSKPSPREHGDDDAGVSATAKNVRGLVPSHRPSWSIYIPMTSLVALCIQESGSDGLTNPQLCAMTIGPSFTRYLAGLTASISADNIQPSNVKHLAVKSERGRPGKSGSLYWYSMVDSPPSREDNSRLATSISSDRSQTDMQHGSQSLSVPYDFTPLTERSSLAPASTLSHLCQRGLSKLQRRGRPKKIRPEQRSSPQDIVSQDLTSIQNSPQRGNRETAAESAARGKEGDLESNVHRLEANYHEETRELDHSAELPEAKVPEPKIPARGRPKTRNSGPANRKLPTSKAHASTSRQFKCEKCAGTWKNDVGLKYHLEKSQTPCNPSFKPRPPPTPPDATLSTSKRHVFNAKKLCRTNKGPSSSYVFVNGSGRGDESPNTATRPTRKEPRQTAESETVNEDISILSGQVGLLTVIPTIPPRQVDPLTKAPTRQSTVPCQLRSMSEDSEAPPGFAELPDLTSEVPESRPATLTSATPPGSSLPAEIVREKSEKPRIKHKARHELLNIITELLHQHSGVLPTGQSLELLVKEKWQTQHLKGDIPTGARVKSVMLQMIREKKIVDQWHAFRTPDGRIGKCQIITIPSVPAFAPETRTLVESIRQLYPTNILPHQIPGSPHVPQDTETPKEDEEDEMDMATTPQFDNKVGGRGRRSLAADVAILSAPVYAAQIATKRVADSSEIPSSPAKRRRHAEAPTHGADGRQSQQFWPVAAVSAPSSKAQQLRLSACTGITLDISLEDAQKAYSITGTDPQLSIRNSTAHGFECLAASMQQSGWIAGSCWFSWASCYQIPSQASQTPYDDRSQHDYFAENLKLCMDIEMNNGFDVRLPTEVRSVFINFLGGDTGNHVRMPCIQWNKSDKQPSKTSAVNLTADDNTSCSSPASLAEEPEPQSRGAQESPDPYSVAAPQAAPTPSKRVVLAARNLMPLAPDVNEQRPLAGGRGKVDDNELVAAFVIIRSLLGGVDKLIDWGLLSHLFPTIGLQSLRRFWARIRKEKGPLLLKATQDFQERFIVAVQNDEVAIPDYDRLLDYNWKGLFKWAMQHPNQEQLQLPASRESLLHEFELEDVDNNSEDWREKFFHPQSSVYSRFEAATLQPGSLTVSEVAQMSKLQPTLSTVDIARSWIRSLCCTSETEYTPQDVKERFSMLSEDALQRSSIALKTAIDQLTKERVICKSKRTPFGGRPYRLNEGYTSVLTKVSHREKYLDAVFFKNEIDKAFRSDKIMKVPYTLSDGAMMALINLIATERIRIKATEVPNIPFGFEPGNYESRKYPKSYYHMDLEVQPTQTYLFNDDIDVLRQVQRVGPPREGRKREIPQWIDFFGKLDEQRWADILGAVSFVFNTRGAVSVRGICDAVAPILDEFEAQLIISWGLKTGVFVRARKSSEITLGEWWWLVAHRLPS